jgi:enterobactin synthetase component D / holo-[acyl-carrier protein] synthase
VIEEILPAAAVSVESRGDIEDVVLFPVELAAVGRAVAKRRREFATVRACAREAFGLLGIEPAPVPHGARGEPLWPNGIVGSITHCDGYRAVAIAPASALTTIGIDAEPHEPLPDGVLEVIADEEERAWLARLGRSHPQVCWDRLLFSAKESIYKAWFPLAHSWLGFEDAHVELDLDTATFHAALLAPIPDHLDPSLGVLRGRWLIRDGLVLTAIAIAASP